MPDPQILSEEVKKEILSEEVKKETCQHVEAYTTTHRVIEYCCKKCDLRYTVVE